MSNSAMKLFRTDLETMGYLESALIRDVWLQAYQTRLILRFELLGKSDTRPVRVDAVFDLVHEATFSNGLTPYQILHRAEWDWGLNEIAIVRVDEDPNWLRKYADSPEHLSHVAILWEPLEVGHPERRIDIVFAWAQLITVDMPGSG